MPTFENIFIQSKRKCPARPEFIVFHLDRISPPDQGIVLSQAFSHKMHFNCCFQKIGCEVFLNHLFGKNPFAQSCEICFQILYLQHYFFGGGMGLGGWLGGTYTDILDRIFFDNFFYPQRPLLFYPKYWA